MDALKRAEEAKRQQAAQSGERHDEPAASAGGELSLAPAAGNALPELAEHLAEVDAELRATVSEASAGKAKSPQAAAEAPAEALERQQQAIRNAFAAKSPDPASRYRNLFVIGGVGALLGIGTAGYFYLQLNSLPASGLRPGAALAGAPATPPRADSPPSPPPMATLPAAPPIVAAAQPEPAPSAVRPMPPTAMRETPAAPRNDAAESPIRVSTGTLRLNPAVGKAYQSLQAGDLRSARNAYEDGLKSDPRNVDALLGLAAIAAHEGDSERADALYSRVLDADPKNAAAQAALLGMHTQGDPAQVESRLKGLLAAQSPESASAGGVQFALGNLYARQKRWNEAQAAYFQAYAADAGNPDFHFNLAISLDHLGQAKLAAQFYRSALDATATRVARFDRQQAQSRLAELKQ